jgi:hypothetical protein
MRLLFDECVPRKVTFLFADGGHKCENVRPFETQDSAARTKGTCWPWLKSALTSS